MLYAPAASFERFVSLAILAVCHWFEINFNLDRDSKGVHFEKLEVELPQTAKSAVNFEVFFNLNEHERGLRLDLDYNRQLFSHETWQQWVACFEHLLRELPAHSNIHLHNCNFSPSANKEQLLPSRRENPVPGNSGESAIELIERQVELSPEAIAVSCDKRSFNLREFQCSCQSVRPLNWSIAV